MEIWDVIGYVFVGAVLLCNLVLLYRTHDIRERLRRLEKGLETLEDVILR